MPESLAFTEVLIPSEMQEIAYQEKKKLNFL